MRITVPAHPAWTSLVLAYGETIRDEGHREHVSGQADLQDEPRARASSWRPLRPGQLRPAGRVDMSRAGLEGFGRTLNKEDEVVVEATGNAMAVVRVPEPHVARVIVATRHKSSPMRR